MCTKRLSDGGQSLVQALISVAIMGIGMLIFGAMITSQQRQVARLSQKIAYSDLESVLIASMADGSVCQYVMNYPKKLTFNAGSLPTTVSLNKPATLYTNILSGPTPGSIAAQAGQYVSTLSSSLMVSDITLQITAGGGGHYTGTFNVIFDTSALIQAMAPLSISQRLLVDDSNPSAASIKSCQAMAEPTDIAPIGSIIAWQSSMAPAPTLANSGWALCNGATLHDPLSPFDGQQIPNLNSGVEAKTNYGAFLRGALIAGQHETQATALNGVHLKPGAFVLAAPFSWLGYINPGWGAAQYGGKWSGTISSSDAETHPPSATVQWIMRVH